jgi:hypothetical protein
LIVSAASLLGLIACGGATGNEDLFTGSSTGSSSSGGTSSGDAGGTTTKDAAVTDAKPLPPIEAGAPDATPPPKPTTLLCGQDGSGAPLFCAGNKPLCCASLQGGSIASFQCRTNQTQCINNGSIPISCATDVDCAKGTVCCGHQDTFSGLYTEVACRASCSGQVIQGEIRLCDMAVAPNVCDALGMTCSQSTVLPGYYRCQ